MRCGGMTGYASTIRQNLDCLPISALRRLSGSSELWWTVVEDSGMDASWTMDEFRAKV